MPKTQINSNVNHSAVLNEQLQGKDNLVDISLTAVGPMVKLASTASWVGSISITGENELNSGSEEVFYELIKRSIVTTPTGGQRGCMDGRALPNSTVLGPKTAGGTFGDALRVMLASHAYNRNSAMTYKEAVDTIIAIDQKFGFVSGGHELEQCGAYKFASYGIETIAKAPELVSEAVINFVKAVGHDYSNTIQESITYAAKNIASNKTEYIPNAERVTSLVTPVNSNACPILLDVHKEHDILIFLKDGITLDNNKLIKLTNSVLDNEVQAFAYNWNYHLAIAKELGNGLGDFYLQSVPSQDAPVLTQLTDGSVQITAVK